MSSNSPKWKSTPTTIACAILCGISAARAQVNIDVAGPSFDTGSSEFVYVPLTTSGQTYLSDPLGDNQGGSQADDDFVGGSTTDPGFFIQHGLLNGDDALAFRLRLDGVTNNNNYKGILRVGIDYDNDGAVNIAVGPQLTGSPSSQGIVFQLANGSDNLTPDTTSFGSAFDRIAFVTSGGAGVANYNYAPVDSTNSPESTGDFNGDSDAILTFAFPISSLEAALNLTPGTITSEQAMRFMAYTTNQIGSINRDLFGSNGIDVDTSFVSAGFSEATAFDGTVIVIPEPSTWISMATLLFPVAWRTFRRRTRSPAR